MKEVKQVIVWRKDLKVRKGKMAAQVAHASMKVFFDRMEKMEGPSPGFPSEYVLGPSLDLDWSAVQTWIEGGFAKIVVGCADERELFELRKLAKDKGLPTALITDAGRTEFKGPTNTCLAIGPAPADLIDKVTGHLPLM